MSEMIAGQEDLEGFGGAWMGAVNEGPEGFEGIWTGTGGFSGLNSSFGTSAGPARVAPQILQNLSSGLTFPPHFGQKFAIILIFLINFRPYLNFTLNRRPVKKVEFSSK